MTRQARVDSFMEAVTNTSIGFLVSMVTWHFVALGFGIPMPLTENLKITAIFTIVSIARQYVLRRVFDGRTPWAALKTRFVRADRSSAPSCHGSNPGPQQQAENDCCSRRWQGGCIGTFREYRGRRA